MNCDKITFRINCIYAGNVLYVPGQHPRRIDGNIRVIAVNLHPQRSSCIGYLCSNRTKTDHSKFLSFDLSTSKSLFAFLNRFGNILVVLVVFTPCNSPYNVPACQQKPCQQKLLHSIGIGSRSVKNHNACLCTVFQRNVIYPCTSSGNCKKGIGKCHFVKGGASHQNALCLLNLIGQLIVLGEKSKSVFGNCV